MNQDEDQVDPDILSQKRLIYYVLSKSRDLKIKSRVDFEEDFDDIKDLKPCSWLMIN